MNDSNKDFRAQQIQSQGILYIGERVVTTPDEAVIYENDFTLAVDMVSDEGPVVFTLPSLSDEPVEPGARRLRFRDKKGNASIHNIQIVGPFVGGATMVVIDTDGGSVVIESVTDKWQVWALGTVTSGSAGLTNLIAGPYIVITPVSPGVLQVAVDLAALKADLLTRPTRQLWIGDALSGTVTPDGSAVAPYSMAQAITWINTQIPGVFDFKASAQSYGAMTWPAGYGGAFDCLAGGATVSDLTLDPFSGPAQRLTFRGFDVGDVDTSTAAAPTDTVLLRIERQGTIGTLGNTGGADVYLELVGAEEPTAVPASVSALGPLDKGAGTLTIQADSADIQQAVDCTSYTSTDCRNPENITASDITVTEAEDDQGVRSGSIWTATSCRIDQITAQRFATAGGSLVGGTFTLLDDGPWIASQGKTALVPGTPVYMLDDGGTLKVQTVDGTFAALRQDFVGFAELTTAADGDAQLVVGNGGRAISIPGAITGGVYGALVPGKAYYVSGAVGVSTTVWLIFSEDDFSGIGGFNSDAPAGSGYRLIGIADTTTTIMQAWEDAATT